MWNTQLVIAWFMQVRRRNKFEKQPNQNTKQPGDHYLWVSQIVLETIVYNELPTGKMRNCPHLKC